MRAGFADLQRNATALAAAGGDLARAVEHLVAAEKPQQLRQS
jgi:ATP/maltotriose-dependent transcriptional regulator MalT